MITVQSNVDIPEHSVDRRTIDRWLLHATHFLPAQGPIKVFVHHNTLHAFEDLSFDEGVLEGLRIYNSQPYFSEDRFRKEMQTGRIRLKDLEQVLLDDLGNEADRLVASFGTRYQLRLAMMQYPLRTLPDRELTWLIAEGGALQEFFCEVESEDIRSIVEKTRNDLSDAEKASHERISILPKLLNGSSVSTLEAWPEAKWKSFTLEYLWAACKQGVQSSDSRTIHNGDAQTPLHTSTPAEQREANRLVNDFLIRFCGCYLDQGFATWPMPDREHGFLNAFCSLYGSRMAMLPGWLKQLPTEIVRIRSANQDAYEVVQEELKRSQLDSHACEELVKRKLLALRGWAGMIWQMETSAPWTPKPAPAGSLVGY